MTTFNKQDISTLLQGSIQTVSFTKVNGDIRKMDCTLMAEHLPAVAVTESDKPKRAKAPNDTLLSVWDVKAAGWRSFRIDNVFEITPAV